MYLHIQAPGDLTAGAFPIGITCGDDYSTKALSRSDGHTISFTIPFSLSHIRANVGTSPTRRGGVGRSGHSKHLWLGASAGPNQSRRPSLPLPENGV